MLAFLPVTLSKLITITTPAGSIFWFDTLANREQQLTAVIHCSLHCSLVTRWEFAVPIQCEQVGTKKVVVVFFLLLLYTVNLMNMQEWKCYFLQTFGVPFLKRN